MNSGQQTKCNQCLEAFDVSRSPMKMPNCSHNICSKCLHEIKSEKLNVIQCEFCHNSINDGLTRKFQPNILLKGKITRRSLLSPNKTTELVKKN